MDQPQPIQPKRPHIRKLETEEIFRYLMELSDELETLILCNPDQEQLIATDQALYEAVGSIPDPASMNQRKLIKLLEVVNLVPARARGLRTVLTPKRVEDVRSSLKRGGEQLWQKNKK